MRTRVLVIPVFCLLAAASSHALQKKLSAPETFTANLNVTGAAGGAAAATIGIDIQRYTPDADRTAVEAALKYGGYPGFLTALRKAPEVGAVTFGTERWPIRWARERPSGQYGRNIVVVTDKPIFFVGGGKAEAKPRVGYEVAVIQFEVDGIGLGQGTMTAAARVKPDGQGGVVVDDYAEKPITLVTVTRTIK